VSATLACLVLAACGGEAAVSRVYDGKVVNGPYISPDAYAWFLRGVLAAGAGDDASAISSFERAAREDDRDPAIFAALGEARSGRDPQDRAADAALPRALPLDGAYAGALAAASRCAELRKQPDLAATLANKAAAEDPKNVALEALAIKAEAR